MEEYTLEREFSIAVFMHKSTMIKGALLKYYTDLASTGVTLPDCMQDSPEKKTDIHFCKLLENKTLFNEMYDRCWNRYAEVLP